MPPFWRTWWFSGLTVAALLGVTLLAYQRRVAYLKRRHAVQAAHACDSNAR